MTLLTAGLGLLAGCGADGQEGATQAPPAKAVTAVVVQQQALELASELPGRVEPVRVAEVRARVPGIVLSRQFEEGATVKAGQVLFQIDPAPFKVALARARGELARVEAQLAEAQAVVKRYAPLVEADAVSRQDFDAAQSALASAKAARQAALAEVDNAGLNLGLATVRAPISGRIGRALVTEGALVGQNEATPLAIVQQIDEVYVDFKQPLAEAQALQAALGQGKLARADGASISLTIEGNSRRRQGKLLFSDIAVDRATGQVTLRGRFANPDGALLPGMYVRVNTPLATDRAAILVPQRAVQRGVDGKPFVLTVGKDNLAAVRAVQTGAMHGTTWQITSGLNPGDRVITDGQAQPGQPVSVDRPAAASTLAAAGARQ